nr:hypothetical protein [Aureimonas psammosilenae]
MIEGELAQTVECVRHATSGVVPREAGEGEEAGDDACGVGRDDALEAVALPADADLAFTVEVHVERLAFELDKVPNTALVLGAELAHDVEDRALASEHTAGPKRAGRKSMRRSSKTGSPAVRRPDA